MAERDEIHSRLLSEDAEFRTWTEEHRRFESRLATLAAKSVLSEEEEVEEKTLKKRKLHLKDRMAEKIRGYEVAHRG